MSCGPTTALMLPSVKRTRPCTSDCGCTTTSICSSGISKRKCASKTSRPLLKRVAESMVTFGPMFQLGWASACSRVTLERSAGPSRKGPPEAVSTSAATVSGSSPRRHWKRAECSESTGVMRPPCSRASSHMSGPATTMASLLASATCRPARSAAAAGARPAMPGRAATTTSAWAVATASRPSLPTMRRVPAGSWSRISCATDSCTATTSGRNSSAWRKINSELRPAANATTRWPCQRATSSVWVPIEPVDPRIARRFISSSCHEGLKVTAVHGARAVVPSAEAKEEKDACSRVDDARPADG